MILNVYKEQNIKELPQNTNNKLNSLELQKIRELIDLDSIEYMSDNVKNILKIVKENSEKCFIYEKRNKKSIFRVVLYIRLSEEDGDLIDGDVSKSIRNQLLLLLDECKQKKWKVVGIFCEEDISGADDNRPEWKKSLNFCKCNRADIMLCKSQSRFSRNMEMIEKYLHKEFVDWGIRFVGVVDKADTSEKGNKKARQINALTNEWQVEDQSINTREVLKNKKRLGLYATAWTPYGYIKNPKDKYQLVVDKEAALIVKRIFEEYMSGVGTCKIAKGLNQDRIPTTWEHMKSIGLKIANRNPIKIITYQTEKNETLKSIADRFYISIESILQSNEILEEMFEKCEEKIEKSIFKEGIILTVRTKPVWDDKAVRNILRNESYTGYLVLGKYKNKSYKDKTRVRIPKDEWIRVPNCHEPIIDRNYWLVINNKLEFDSERITCRNKTQNNGMLSIFSKKVFCECCNSIFSISTKIKAEKDNYYLKCRGTRKDKARYAFCDNKKTIKKSDLEEIILKKLNEQIKRYFDLSKVEKNYYEKKVNNDANEEISILELEKENAYNEINKKTNLLNMLYDDRASGVISIEEFKILKDKNSRDIDFANERIQKIEEKLYALNKRKEVELQSQKLFTKYKKIKKLDRKIMNEFVEKIVIGKYDKATNSRNIKIVWNINES